MKMHYSSTTKRNFSKKLCKFNKKKRTKVKQKNKVKPKSEIQIRHDFQESVCRKEGNQCPFWDRGCTKQIACKKLAGYRQRVKKKEKEIIEEESRIEKAKKNKVFTKAIMLNILLDFEICTNNGRYKYAIPIDEVPRRARLKAKELGIEEEFIEITKKLRR